MITLGCSLTFERLELPAQARPLTLLWVTPGRFRMGDPGMYEDGGEPFDVMFTKGFWLGQYLVTQSQWQTVMHYNPSHFQTNGVNRPVENVSWDEAMAFCATLNQQWSVLLPPGYLFSLPTEAQWEYACRAGTQSRYPNGDSEAGLDQIAWHEDNSAGTTQPVGEKAPNPWGFYDIQGNVTELCFDQMGMGVETYPRGVAVDWVGTSERVHPRERGTAEQHHVVRSGGYTTPRSSQLFWCSGFLDQGVVRFDTKRPWFGFRLCLRHP